VTINLPQRITALSLCAAFSGVAGITLATTYVDILFLSTYASELLPHLFLVKTFVLLVLTFLVGRLVAMGSPAINAATMYVAAFSAAGAYFLIGFSGLPFAISVWLDVISVLAGVVVFSAVNEAFDIREIRRVGPWIYSAGGVGGLILGGSVPFWITHLPAQTLLFAIGVAFALAGVCLSQLSPLTKSSADSPAHPPLRNHRLFVITFIAFVLLLIADTFADYFLKSAVAERYSNDEIGAFMGPFYGVTNVITVVLQIVLVSRLLQRFGIFALLTTLPVFTLLCGGILIALPGIVGAVIFRMGEIICRRAFDDFARSLVINPLPA